jgi:hypothetical protein
MLKNMPPLDKRMSGYVVCLSNPSFADCYYISVTTKRPNERADELYSEGVLWPFKIEMAKHVAKVDGKLASLHKLVGKMGERLTPDRDYFHISLDVVQSLFDLIDGEFWTEEPAQSISAADKVAAFLKQDNPKANELQLGKMKVKVMASLKGRYGDADPTLEMVRECLETAKPNAVVPV